MTNNVLCDNISDNLIVNVYSPQTGNCQPTKEAIPLNSNLISQSVSWGYSKKYVLVEKSAVWVRYKGVDQLKDNWIIEKMCQRWGRLQNSGTVELTMGWQEALFEMLLFTALLTVYRTLGKEKLGVFDKF